MKRALFVSYYFPPVGGVGAFRPLKYAKYLPEYGWSADVLTVDPRAGTKIDPSLSKDVRPETRVVQAASWEVPFRKLDKLPLIKYWRLLTWPDSAIGWLPHAVRAGREMARETPYDVIFSTAPPYSAHLVAERLQRELGLPWVADFRDPWSQNRSLHRLQPWRKGLDRRAETRILARANHVLTVTEALKQDLIRDFGTPAERITAITNGFDAEDFPPTPPPANETMTVMFTGSAYGDYNPMRLLEGLDRFAREHPEARFKVRLIGAVSQWMRGHAANRQLAYPVELVDFIPHEQIPGELQGADLLLVSYPEWLLAGIPSKLFEYMAAKRPVLALFSPEAEAGEVIRETGSGTVVTEASQVAEAFARLYRDWEAGKPLFHPIPERIGRFDRRLQAGVLAGIFDRLLERQPLTPGAR